MSSKNAYWLGSTEEDAMDDQVYYTKTSRNSAKLRQYDDNYESELEKRLARELEEERIKAESAKKALELEKEAAKKMKIARFKSTIADVEGTDYYKAQAARAHEDARVTASSAAVETELRWALDGNLYTKAQFVAFYGGTAEWHVAKKYDPEDTSKKAADVTPEEQAALDKSSLYPPEKIAEMREIKRRIELKVIDLNNELQYMTESYAKEVLEERRYQHVSELSDIEETYGIFD